MGHIIWPAIDACERKHIIRPNGGGGYVCYVFILQQDNTQNIKPEGQQGSEALTAARNKKCLEQIVATTHNMTETKHNKIPSLMNSGPERTT